MIAQQDQIFYFLQVLLDLAELITKFRVTGRALVFQAPKEPFKLLHGLCFYDRSTPLCIFPTLDPFFLAIDQASMLLPHAQILVVD